MEIPTSEEYQKALEIVNLYQAETNRLLQIRKVLFEIDSR